MKSSENPLSKIAAFSLFILIASLLVTSCARYSFFTPDGSYEGSILELAIEEMLRVEEVAYREDPEGGKALVFKDNGAQDKGDSLAGTSWILESQGELFGREIPSPWEGTRMQVVDMDLVIAGTKLTVEFEDGGGLQGNAGCNSYFSSNYSATDGAFYAGHLSATEKHCDTPAGVMEQEAQFLELLRAADSYSISDDMLTIAVPGHVRDYVIRPSSEENELVVTRARIGNNATTSAQLDIEALPPELRMDSGRYQSVNIYEARMPAEGFHAEMNEFLPLIRDFHYLEKGAELEGWLIFDVPKGSVAQSFKWEAGGDIIIIDF